MNGSLAADDPKSPTSQGAGELAKLPEAYGRTRLVLMEVEPRLVHAYWEMTPLDCKAANEQSGADKVASWILRFYECNEEGTARPFFDVPVNLDAHNWYIGLGEAEKPYYAELGLQDSKRQSSFLPVCRSNTVRLPRAAPSSHSDPRWFRINEKGEFSEEVEPASPCPACTPGEASPKPSPQAPINSVPCKTPGPEPPPSPAVAAAEGSCGVEESAPAVSISPAGPPSPQPGNTHHPASGSGGGTFPSDRFTAIERPGKL